MAGKDKAPTKNVNNYCRSANSNFKSDVPNANLLASFSFSPPSKTLFSLTADGSTITYGQFETRVKQYSTQLRREFRITKGDRIAAQVTKSPDAIALYLATLRIGAVYVPLNTDYKLDEIRYFLHDSQPSLFVCRPIDKAAYSQLVVVESPQSELRCSVIDETELSLKIDNAAAAAKTRQDDVSSVTGSDDEKINNYAPETRQDDVSSVTGSEDEKINTYAPGTREDDVSSATGWSDSLMEHVEEGTLAAICYTSGTTGAPKGAMITHGNLSSNARALCSIWRVQHADVLLHALPIYHVHGLFVAVNTTLAAGASMIFAPRFEADLLVQQLPGATLMMGVPTYYTRLLQCPKLDRTTCGNMRLFISGSAPLLENTWNEFKERTGHQILERYGMTEGQMVCSNPYEGKRKPGTVGRPLPQVTVRIRNGVLEYKGPNLFAGYWRKPEKTKEDFTQDDEDDEDSGCSSPGYFISGDLADIDEDGYVRILGRCKDLIITGGLNVYPKEVENVVDALPDVSESAVIGIPHPDFGEAVVAVVVLRGKIAAEKVDDPKNQIMDQVETKNKEITDMIRKILKARMAGFKVPKRVFVQSQLPRNTMGKIQKNVLRERYRHIFEI